MGAASNRKGKSGEREAAAILREVTGFDVQRRVRQNAGDSDLVALPGWCVEVKRYKTISTALLSGFWAQVCKEAASSNDRPLLMFRGDNRDWACLWTPLTMGELGMIDPGRWLDVAFRTSPGAWWSYVRS